MSDPVPLTPEELEALLRALNAAANRHGSDHELHALCSHLHAELPRLLATLDAKDEQLALGERLLGAMGLRAERAEADRDKWEQTFDKTADALDAEIRLRKRAEAAHERAADAFVDEAKAREAAEAERDEALRLKASAILRELDALRRAKTAETEVARLREALDDYGEHSPRCQTWGAALSMRQCDCGYDQAMVALVEHPQEPQP